MKATVCFVKERFRHFNNLCFGGELPEVPVRLSNARTFYGLFRHPRLRDPRHPLGGECNLAVSTRYDLDPRVLEDVIIHEMIHLYIWWKGIRDSSPHGEVFTSIMNRINSSFQRNITVSRHTSSKERDSDSHIKNHYICLTYWNDGRTLITLAARTCIFVIHEAFTRHPALLKMEWYWSTDPFFNRFPISRTPKAYLVDKDELSARLPRAVRCECNGKSFRACRK